MGTKAILNDDGRLTIHARVVILLDNGRKISGVRTGNSYFTQFARNVDNAFHNAIMDIVYQLLYENDYSINGSDGSPIGSGELLDKYSLDSYKIYNYDINYLSDINKRGRYKYVTKNVRNKRYVFKYDKDNNVVSKSPYIYLSNKEIESRDLVEDYQYSGSDSGKAGYYGHKKREVKMDNKKTIEKQGLTSSEIVELQRLLKQANREQKVQIRKEF